MNLKESENAMSKRTVYLMLLFAIVLPTSAAMAQNAQVQFTYDADGNRTVRTIVLKKVEENGKDTEVENSFLAETNERFGTVQISIYPNPTTGKVTIELTEITANGIGVLLTAVTGAVIENCRLSGLHHDFDLSGQPAGVYLLRLFAEDEIRTWKIVKH